MSQVKSGDTVKVHYTGKLNNGQVFDTSKDRDPLQFEIGAGQMIPGFEEGVMGMEIEQEKTIEIPSEKAYGPRMDELFIEVKNEQLPEGLKPEKGMELVTKRQDGTEAIVKVDEVKDSSIVIDANHPLAGQDLTFNVKLVEIA